MLYWYKFFWDGSGVIVILLSQNSPTLICAYSGRRPSYMIDSSPYAFPQFLTGMVHFFTASKVARYRAFNRAWSLGNTLLWRLAVQFLYLKDHSRTLLFTRQRKSWKSKTALIWILHMESVTTPYCCLQHGLESEVAILHPWRLKNWILRGI